MSGFSTAWLSLVTAVRFLTIIPVPVSWPTEQNNQSVQAGSLLFYPVVGALIGGCLIAVYLLTGIFTDGLSAMLLLIAWVIVTGALHLDGLADSADAWLGGHGDKDKTLNILKDTHAGVAAIVSIVLVLLLKLVLLAELNANLMMALFIAPVIARAAVSGLLACTPYVRENGIAAVMLSNIPGKKIWGSLLGISLVLILWGGVNGILIILSVSVAVVLFRLMICRRIGGTTGDTAGALIELIEVLVLFNFVIIEQLR